MNETTVSRQVSIGQAGTLALLEAVEARKQELLKELARVHMIEAQIMLADKMGLPLGTFDEDGKPDDWKPLTLAEELF